MLASEQRYLAEIILTQLTIKVPNFGPKNSNFACKSQIFRISFQKMLRSLGLGLGLETFAKFLRLLVSVSKNLVSEKKYRFRFRKNLVSEKSLGFGIGKFGLGRKVSVSVSEKSLGFGKFGIVKKVSVSVLVKILVSSFSAPPPPLMALFPIRFLHYFLLQLNLTYETDFTLLPSQKYHF